MITRTMPIWPTGAKALADGSGDDFLPVMECYLSEAAVPRPSSPRSALVIFPGGGYCHRAPHEGVSVAERFTQFGLHCFVVQYRVSPHVYPTPMQDGFRAIQLIRMNAERFGIDPQQLAVIGFSAGGHLCASMGTLFDDAEIDSAAGDEADAQPRRPNALCLCYPVINDEKGSMQNLQGTRYPSLSEKLFLDRRVSAATPPSFLWHTANDPGVPVHNSLDFFQALRHHEIPAELHIFPDGPHGLGLAPKFPDIAQWPELARVFLRHRGFNC